jgi:hypothetical protein
MTRLFRFGKLVSLPAVAVMSLLASALIAPPAAQAGCSHVVTSRTTPGRIPSLIAPSIHDPAGGVARPYEPLTVPPLPRHCSGALCSPQPAAPAVPAGVFDGQVSSWAWCALMPGLIPPDSFSLASETSELHTVRRRNAVFHPPRLYPLA